MSLPAEAQGDPQETAPYHLPPTPPNQHGPGIGRVRGTLHLREEDRPPTSGHPCLKEDAGGFRRGQVTAPKTSVSVLDVKVHSPTKPPSFAVSRLTLLHSEDPGIRLQWGGTGRGGETWRGFPGGRDQGTRQKNQGCSRRRKEPGDESCTWLDPRGVDWSVWGGQKAFTKSPPGRGAGGLEGAGGWPQRDQRGRPRDVCFQPQESPAGRK